MKPAKVIMCFAAGAVIAASAGSLSVPPEGVDFGEIAAGTNAAKTVEIRNIGSHDIRISRVKPCCGAEAALSKMILKS